MVDEARGIPEFDGPLVGRHVLRSVRAGALATLDREAGFPFASLVTVATDLDGSPLLLLSRLAAHTLNLEHDARASLLLAQGGKGDPLAHPRLTVMGRLARTGEPRIRARFLARQPKAALYADFPDFSFWRLDIESGHLNGGFARAAMLSSVDLRLEIADADSWHAVEVSAIAHMNEDHREALALYASELAGAGEGEWRATGLDPDGLDLAAGDRVARVPFPFRLPQPDGLRSVLKAMADKARARRSGVAESA